MFAKIWERIGQWFCKMGWHKGELTYEEYGLLHARCVRCGYEGLVDSYGQLF